MLVASDLSGDSMLVAWYDLKLLEVISPNFPARISATVSKKETSDKLKYGGCLMLENVRF